tara:strand:- start:11949 stop:12677 length:729 start_codon:yes stop_codon:yes gene_type:complete
MKFSIITTVLNGEAYIEKSIDSAIKAFSDESFEHLIIDAGSKDNTLNILNRYDHLDIEVKEGISIAKAWNYAIKKAKGDLILLLNADDYLSKEFSSALAQIKKGSSDVYFGDVDIVNSFGSILRTYKGKTPNRFNILSGFSFLHPGTFVSIECYKKVGLFDVNRGVGMDSDWLVRAFYSDCKFEYHGANTFMLDGGLSVRSEFKGFGEYLQSLADSGAKLSLVWSLLIKVAVILKRALLKRW